MMELTQDQYVIIPHNWFNGSSWIIFGKCSELDKDCNERYELDCPVTPDTECGCGLKGVWT